MATIPLFYATDRHHEGDDQWHPKRYGSKGCGRDRGCPLPPRTDPYVQNYRIRLLPRV